MITKKFIIEAIFLFLLALVVVLPIRFFIFQPFFVKYSSMEPTYHNGDYLIVDELTYKFREPKREEVVVFHYPLNPKELFIKRIIGLPGETLFVKDNKISIRYDYEDKVLEEKYLTEGTLTPGKITITLKPDEYFVLGDNREHSSDSRMWGPIKTNSIIGRVVLRPISLVGLQNFLKQSTSSNK
ncbi:MAG: signal peptidase I [bacterium]|nr:signal peptidase I [bacterium]